MKTTYTFAEVIDILVALQIFEGTPLHKTLKDIPGINYGHRAENIIEAHDMRSEEQSVLSIVYNLNYENVSPNRIDFIMPEGPIEDDYVPPMPLYPECEQFSIANVRKSLGSEPLI